jgi:hypothetical protein
MGGAKGDAQDLYPGCDLAHREFGERPQMGRWEGTQRARAVARYGLNPEDVAAAIATMIENGDPPSTLTGTPWDHLPF